MRGRKDIFMAGLKIFLPGRKNILMTGLHKDIFARTENIFYGRTKNIFTAGLKIFPQQGYRRFQLKLGGDPDTDIARIKACRAVMKDGEVIIIIII